MGTRSRRSAQVVLAGIGVAMMAIGCAPGLEAKWQGSGETFEARYFQFALDLQGGASSAAWIGQQGAEVRLAVCGLAKGENGVVEFRMDPETPAVDCQGLKRPMTFQGTFGHGVLAGTVLDAGGRTIGRFRAFRTRD